jgi:tRNA (guanine-N7-)-methyltransferase
MTIPEATEPRLFGRRKGRPLRVRKAALLATLPDLQINLPSPEGGTINAPSTWFNFTPKNYVLEIGFGGGEHLAAQAARHPETGFIGCEPFLNGIASMLDHMDRQKLRNIRIFPSDARLILAALPPASLTTAFVLFADPWPKNRHAARRFIQAETLRALARVLPCGAKLRVASDHPVLQEWTTEHITQCHDFVPEHGTGISPERPADWVITRYEEKALIAGRTPLYYCFKRA